MFQTAYYVRYFDVMQNLWHVNNVFSRGGKSFILLKLSTRAFSEHLSKAEKKKTVLLYFSPYLKCNIEQKEIAMGMWFFFFRCQHCVAQKEPSPCSKWIKRGRYICLLVYISIRLSIYPSIYSPVCCSEQRFHMSNGYKNKKEEERREREGCLEQSRALSLWHKSSLWSLEHNRASPLHPWARQQIIPIMQHVCDCRNPPWPYLSSL